MSTHARGIHLGLAVVSGSAWLVALLGAASIAGALPGWLAPAVTFVTGCPLSAATGDPCPLCGTIHALRDLLAGNLADSLETNPLALGLVPLGLGQVIYRVVRVRKPRFSWQEELVLSGVGGLWLALVLLRS